MSEPADWGAAAGRCGMALAIIGGIFGLAVNGWGGAALGAIGGFGAGVALIRMFQGLGYVILGGLILLTGYVGLKVGWARISSAATPPDAVQEDRIQPLPRPSASPSSPTWRPTYVPTPTPTPEVADIPEPAGLPIRFHNECKYAVRVAIEWDKPGDGRYAEGWWKFQPDEFGFMKAIGGGVIRSETPDFYFYAEPVPAGVFNWKGDRMVTLGDRRLPMLAADPKRTSDAYEFSVLCPGR